MTTPTTPSMPTHEHLLAELREGLLTEFVLESHPPSDWTALVEAAEQSPLQRICLTNLTLRGVAEAAALQLLRSHQETLAVVELEGLQLAASSARVYAEALKWSRLEELSLAQNTKLGPRGIKAWSEFFPQGTQLRRLNCEACGMGHFGAQAVGQVLPCSLQSLNLSDNKLGADGIWKLASRLRLLTDLRSLDLSRNLMGDDGCLELAANLSTTSLQTLHLAGNGIGDTGLAELARSLPALPHMRHLDLSNNQLANASAQDLGSMLRKSPSLELLDLSYNQIADQGCVALVEGLLPPDEDDEEEESDEDEEDDFEDADEFLVEEGGPASIENSEKGKGLTQSCLRELRLDHNAIGDEGAGALVEHLDQMSALQTVTLEGNVISDARLRIVDMLLKHRTQMASPRKLIDPSVTSEATERDEECPPVETPMKGNMSEQQEEAAGDDSEAILQGREMLLSTVSSDDDEGAPELPMRYLRHITRNWSRIVHKHGAFGPLFRAEDADGDNGALWFVRRLTMASAGKLEGVRTAVLAEFPRVQHEAIVPLIGTSLTEGSYAFLYEVPDPSAVSLRKALTNGEHRKTLTWNTRIYIGWSIASALEYLHSNSPGRKAAFHGDLQPDTVFVSTDNEHVFLLDGGLSRLLATDRSRFAPGDVVYGTRGYRCPRYERGSTGFDTSSDVFSLGVLLAEIFTSRLQRSKDNKSVVAYDVYYDCILSRQTLRTDPVAGPISKLLMQSIGQLIVACLSPLPQQRPTASTVAQILKDLLK
jgi:hypothetical protein